MITYSNFGVNGRLGNQMFQYSTLFATAKRLGVQCVIPRRIYKSSANYESMNDLFEFCPDGFEGASLFRFPDVSLYQKYILPEFKKHFSESGFAYDSNIMNVQDETNLNGFFQSEKYFKTERKALLDIFILKADTCSDGFQKAREIIEKSKTTSMHMRRGDYVGKSHFHNNLADTFYYVSAFEKIKEQDQNRKFLVFSDDIPFCKNYIAKYFEESVDDFFFVEGTTGPEEIVLMSLCHDNIIANSSFSWWGAWLNQRNNNLVIAPSNWFGPAGPKDTQDVYCEGWIKL